MHSRAYALLQRDFRELMEKGYPGITAFPLSEDMMAWKADIEGLQNSIWQGLVFDVAINFTPGYNSVPPAVRFVTIPFHPNVNPDTGEPCIDFLNNSHKWNPKYTLSSILLALQVMLSNPVTENPVNLEAAQMLSQDEAMYQIVLRRLFQRSLQLDDGSVLLPKHAHELTSAENRTKARTGARPPKVISFDDYHKTWCGIATSKATESHRRPLLEDPDLTGQYSKWKEMDLQYPEEWKSKFAATRSRGARERRAPASTIPSGERTHPCPTPVELPTESQPEIDDLTETPELEEEWMDEVSAYDDDRYNSWEYEVDDLVAWANTLSTDALED
ncbi:PREDICTED: ubiquitin-conjugating enzyme E2 U isoform X1 [Chinchilla lanigera]|uniref:ubiquitin-conjugating enzyme E2 U isoform X1 n=1 Tax=Chinchilla lanigera TaxID=34839 RepID=UPI000697AC73|nr:PREDICTED: ubiquitin-conjugating enzyme E2 U isoform X1 [Chinchilla lanigera]